MKHILPALQIIFLIIGAALTVSIKSDRDTLALAWWQMVVGLSQLFIAACLTFLYWKSVLLKRLYALYWLFVIAEFIMLSRLQTDSGPLYNTILFGIPWCIATYFTVTVFITFYSKKIRYEK